MTSKGKQKGEKLSTAAPPKSRSSEQSQADFEIEFFGRVLENCPDYVEVLRVMGNNMTLKKRFREGLELDRRLVQLRPRDPLAHYNLACSYALMQRKEAALTALETSVNLGYRDFRYMRQDRDLDPIRNEPRFRQLLREYDKP